MLRFVLAAAFLAAPLAAPRAIAEQMPCGKRPTVLEHLAIAHAESPVAFGVARNGGLVEFLSSVDGDNWTLLVTWPDGTTCVITAGESWRPATSRKPDNRNPLQTGGQRK